MKPSSRTPVLRRGGEDDHPGAVVRMSFIDSEPLDSGPPVWGGKGGGGRKRKASAGRPNSFHVAGAGWARAVRAQIPLKKKRGKKRGKGGEEGRAPRPSTWSSLTSSTSSPRRRTSKKREGRKEEAALRGWRCSRLLLPPAREELGGKEGERMPRSSVTARVFRPLPPWQHPAQL